MYKLGIFHASVTFMCLDHIKIKGEVSTVKHV